MNLLKQAADMYGFTSVDDMLDEATFESVVPGICRCGYVMDVEPDGNGWCEECEKPSCTSVLLLAGLI